MLTSKISGGRNGDRHEVSQKRRNSSQSPFCAQYRYWAPHILHPAACGEELAVAQRGVGLVVYTFE